MIKVKVQGLIKDEEDILQQNEEKRRLLDNIEDAKQEVIEFNSKVSEYNASNQKIIMDNNGMYSSQTLAEIESLMAEKQKVKDKLDVTQKLRENFKSKYFILTVQIVDTL